MNRYNYEEKLGFLKDFRNKQKTEGVTSYAWAKANGIPKTTFLGWLTCHKPKKRKKRIGPIALTHVRGSESGKNYKNYKRLLAKNAKTGVAPRYEVLCHTCQKKNLVLESMFDENKSKKFYCNHYCYDFFNKYLLRRHREHACLRSKAKLNKNEIDPEIVKKFAMVRLFKHAQLKQINQREFIKICKHIDNGHTFMAYLPLQPRTENGNKKQSKLSNSI